jgi:hypothetical protein
MEEGREPCIVPLADMINHNTEDGGCYNFADYGFDRSTRTFRLLSYASYTKGEQVWITYGFKSNWDLLNDYGMVIEGNVHEAVAIDAASLLDAMTATERTERVRFLKQHKLPHVTFQLGGKSEATKQTFVSVRTMLMERARFDQLQTPPDARFSFENEFAVLSFLSAEVEKQLQRNRSYQVRAMSDHQFRALPYHAQLAITFQRTQANALERCAAWLKRRQKRLSNERQTLERLSMMSVSTTTTEMIAKDEQEKRTSDDDDDDDDTIDDEFDEWKI